MAFGLPSTADILWSKKLRWALHVLFWVLVVVFYTLFFGHQNGNYGQTLLFVVLLMPITLLAAYFFIYFLIPRFFEKKRYGRFVLFSFYTILAAVYLEMMAVFAMLFLSIYGEGEPLDPSTVDVYFLIVAMLFVVLLVVALKLLKTWYHRQQLIQDLTQQKLEAELKMLKTQIQPHFLFNSLNSIYALSLAKSDEAPEMVLKLSEILDYLLYECDVPEVPVEKEMRALQNYIDLQKIRFGPRVEVEYRQDWQDKSTKIAPMILMPLAENCFKHGVSRSKDKTRIMVVTGEDRQGFYFTITNDLPANEPQRNDHGGIGLNNITRRLQMSYGDRHLLEVKRDQGQFHVSLRIKNEPPAHA